MNKKLNVVAADEADKPVFANLLQLYLCDMAVYFGSSVNEHGLYDHEILEDCWEHPYLFRLNGDIVGFTLITSHCAIRKRSPCWYVAEFCVLRAYQRKGMGRAAFHAILDRHPGAWEVTWFDGNLPAIRFWPAVIPETDQEIHRLTVDGMDWTSVAFTMR